MSNKAFIDIVSKSFGLYFVVLGLLEVKQGIFYWIGTSFFGNHAQDQVIYLIAIISGVLVNFFFGWFFIFKSDFISNKLTIGRVDQIEINIARAYLIEVVIIGIGMVMILGALPEILTKIGQYIYFNEFGKSEKDLYWNQGNRKADILFSFLKLAFGLIAVTNARNISGRLTRIAE